MDMNPRNYIYLSAICSALFFITCSAIFKEATEQDLRNLGLVNNAIVRFYMPSQQQYLTVVDGSYLGAMTYDPNALERDRLAKKKIEPNPLIREQAEQDRFAREKDEQDRLTRICQFIVVRDAHSTAIYLRSPASEWGALQTIRDAHQSYQTTFVSKALDDTTAYHVFIGGTKKVPLIVLRTKLDGKILGLDKQTNHFGPSSSNVDFAIDDAVTHLGIEIISRGPSLDDSARGKILKYNEPVSIICAHNQYHRAWVHNWYGGVSGMVPQPDDGEILFGVKDVTDTHDQTLANVVYIRSIESRYSTESMMYDDTVEIVSFNGAGGPEALSQGTSWTYGHLWWANNPSGWGKAYYGIIVSPINNIPTEKQTIFKIKSPYGLTGAIYQHDVIELWSMWAESTVWVRPEHFKWGDDVWMPLIGKDMYGIEKFGIDRSLVYCRFIILKRPEAPISPDIKEVFREGMRLVSIRLQFQKDIQELSRLSLSPEFLVVLEKIILNEDYKDGDFLALFSKPLFEIIHKVYAMITTTDYTSYRLRLLPDILSFQDILTNACTVAYFNKVQHKELAEYLAALKIMIKKHAFRNAIRELNTITDYQMLLNNLCVLLADDRYKNDATLRAESTPLAEKIHAILLTKRYVVRDELEKLREILNLLNRVAYFSLKQKGDLLKYEQLIDQKITFLGQNISLIRTFSEEIKEIEGLASYHEILDKISTILTHAEYKKIVFPIPESIPLTEKIIWLVDQRNYKSLEIIKQLSAMLDVAQQTPLFSDEHHALFSMAKGMVDKDLATLTAFRNSMQLLARLTGYQTVLETLLALLANPLIIDTKPSDDERGFFASRIVTAFDERKGKSIDELTLLKDVLTAAQKVPYFSTLINLFNDYKTAVDEQIKIMTNFIDVSKVLAEAIGYWDIINRLNTILSQNKYADKTYLAPESWRIEIKIKEVCEQMADKPIDALKQLKKIVALAYRMAYFNQEQKSTMSEYEIIIDDRIQELEKSK